MTAVPVCLLCCHAMSRVVLSDILWCSFDWSSQEFGLSLGFVLSTVVLSGLLWSDLVSSHLLSGVVSSWLVLSGLCLVGVMQDDGSMM